MKTMMFSATTALLLFTISGCVTYTSTKDEPRQKVGFQNKRAAQTFYEAYLARIHPKSTGLKSLSVSVGLPYSSQSRTSENVWFNHAVKTADLNHDGLISEKEALAYERESKVKAAN